MRTSLVFVMMIFLLGGRAQDPFSNKTNMALEKVIKDFPNRFHNIKGDLIIQRTQNAQYKSTIQVPGSTSCFITHHVATSNDTYSWTCVAYDNRDFNLARTRFKEIYEQIENTIIKIEGEKPFIISGQYRNPVEEKKITTIAFDLLPAVGEMKKLKIELSIENISGSWKVALNVFDNSQKEESSTVAN
jgi:hypothetical protein